MVRRNPLSVARDEFLYVANKSKARADVVQKAEELKAHGLSFDGKAYVFVPDVEFATHWLVLEPRGGKITPKPVLYPLVWLEVEACHVVYDEKKGKMFRLPLTGLSQYVVVEDTLHWYAYAEKLWHEHWVQTEAYKTMMRESFEATRRADREDD